MFPKSRSYSTIAFALLFSLFQSIQAAPTLGGIPLPVRGGLAVVVGEANVPHAETLAKSGKWLVHIVADDAAEQGRILAKVEAQVPLITVGPSNNGALPFGPDSVNMVIQSSKPIFNPEEVSRVLAPKGLSLAGSPNAMEAIEEPVDERYAPWTHWRADEHATGVSRDEAVAPSTSLRWLAQNAPDRVVRTTDGVVGYMIFSLGGQRAHQKVLIDGIEGYDVFSGVPLWHKPGQAGNARRPRGAMVSHPLGFIHLQNDKLKPLVLTDINTGKIIQTYDEGLLFVHPRAKSAEDQKALAKKHGGDPDMPNTSRVGSEAWVFEILVHKDTLIQIHGLDVVALDVASGKRLWDTKLKHTGFVGCVSRDGKRVYIAETPESTRVFGRWGSWGTTGMVALDMTNGKELWRNDEWATSETLRKGKKLKAPTNLSELIEADGTLYAYDPSANIMTDYHADLYAIDIKTGKIKWDFQDANFKDPNHREYAKHGAMSNNMVFWNGWLYNKIACYSLEGPTAERGAASTNGGNMRCVRMSGAVNYLVNGHTGYIGKDGSVYQTTMTRGNCAMPNYPTFGAIVMTTDETCRCYNGFRGKGALVPIRDHRPIANDQRLSKPKQSLVKKAPANLPKTAIVKNWIAWPGLTFFANQTKLGPINLGEVSLSVDVQRHIVTASKGDTILWNYRADGRVHTIPTVVDHKVYVASTAGTVTALNLKDGSILWRFLAAPNSEKVVVNAQVESRWPVYNTVAKASTLYFCAGRQVEADGGIHAWAIDAESGEIQKYFRYFAPITKTGLDSTERRRTGSNWRSIRDTAAKALMPAGLELNEEGHVCFINRRNSGGMTASYNLYWHDLRKRTQGLKDGGRPDFKNPSQELVPIPFEEWNGKIVHPLTGQFADIKHKNLRKKDLYLKKLPQVIEE